MPSFPTRTTSGTNIVTRSSTMGAVAPIRTANQADIASGEV
ncbi:hypothetical protein [Streptomyces lunaelactis]|nr:hypothetical protein [Streptomyces lunaelactis]